MSSSTTLLPSSATSSEAGSIRDCYLYNPDNSEQKQVQILIASAQSKVFKSHQVYFVAYIIEVCLVEGETLLPKVQATLRDSWRPLLGGGLCASQVRIILRVMQSHATSSCMLHQCRGLHQVTIIYSD